MIVHAFRKAKKTKKKQNGKCTNHMRITFCLEIDRLKKSIQHDSAFKNDQTSDFEKLFFFRVH